MQATRIEMVVFDLMGTTVSDDGIVLRAFEEASATLGLRCTREDVLERMGRSKLAVFRELIARDHPPEQVSGLARLALELFEQSCARAIHHGAGTPLYGAIETFNFLHAHGVKLATTTGLERGTHEVLMRSLGWRHRYIDAAVCSSDVNLGRPAPFMIFRAMEALGVTQVSAVVKVGDTPSDLGEGCNAGVAGVVGVTSGSTDASTLSRYPHTHLIDSIADFPELFARDFLRPRTRDSLVLVEQ